MHPFRSASSHRVPAAAAVRGLAATQVLVGLPFGAPVDMWSVGCILAELLLGRPLFVGSTPDEVALSIISVRGPMPAELFGRGKFWQPAYARTPSKAWADGGYAAVYASQPPRAVGVLSPLRLASLYERTGGPGWWPSRSTCGASTRCCWTCWTGCWSGTLRSG